MNEKLTALFDKALRSAGLRSLNSQFLFSYALIFGLATLASMALYSSISISPETINVAGAQRMLSQKMAKEALLLRLGDGDNQSLQATIKQFEQSAVDLNIGNSSRNVSELHAPDIVLQRQKIKAIWDEYLPLLDQVSDRSNAVNMRDFSERSTILLHELNTLVTLMSQQADTTQKSYMWIAFASLLAILALVVLGKQFGLTPLMRKLRQTEIALTQIGAANFTHCLVTSAYDNEIGRIFIGYEQMREEVRSLLSSVKDSAEISDRDVAEALTQVSKTGEQIARQHEDLEQVATAMNEMSATVAEVARHASHTAQSTKEAAEIAKHGYSLVENASKESGALAEKLEQTAESLDVLHLHAGGVSQVLTVISSIAEQTNLLALNAAIEAARAGEAGRGFAVVADEVRSLANRTQQSTQEIRSLIEKLQGGANNAVDSMRASASHAQKNLSEAGHVAQALKSIVRTVDNLNALNQQIATAAEEQSQVANDIDRNITNVSALGKEVELGTNVAIAASHRLQNHMEELKAMLNKFRI